MILCTDLKIEQETEINSVLYLLRFANTLNTFLMIKTIYLHLIVWKVLKLKVKLIFNPRLHRY